MRGKAPTLPDMTQMGLKSGGNCALNTHTNILSAILNIFSCHFSEINQIHFEIKFFLSISIIKPLKSKFCDLILTSKISVLIEEYFVVR